MKLKFFSIILLLTLFLFGFFFIEYKKGKDSKDVPTSTLIPVKSFPSLDSDIFIQQPMNMAFDSEQNVYISDHLGSKILKFDKNGTFLSRIGKRGKGPGEFGDVSEIRINDSLLVANNQSQLQFYDTDGKFRTMFRIFGLQNYWVTKDEIFAFKLNRDPRDLISANNSQIDLIQVFDLKGNKIDAFGETLKGLPFKNSYQKIMGSNILLREFKGNLYVLFRYFPILRIYDLNSYELINEIQFEKNSYKERISQNYDPNSYAEQGTMRLRFLFNAFDVNEEGIFLGLYDDNVLIDQYDFSGKHIHRYKREYEKEPYYLYDTKVFKSRTNGEFKFYTLSKKDNVPLIEIFSLSK